MFKCPIHNWNNETTPCCNCTQLAADGANQKTESSGKSGGDNLPDENYLEGPRFLEFNTVSGWLREFGKLCKHTGRDLPENASEWLTGVWKRTPTLEAGPSKKECLHKYFEGSISGVLNDDQQEKLFNAMDEWAFKLHFSIIAKLIESYKTGIRSGERNLNLVLLSGAIQKRMRETGLLAMMEKGAKNKKACTLQLYKFIDSFADLTIDMIAPVATNTSKL